MSDPRPRYVLSADGFDIYDRWYCHEQVYTTPRFPMPDHGVIVMRVRGDAREALRRTRRRLDTLNAAHDLWLGASATKGRESR